MGLKNPLHKNSKEPKNTTPQDAPEPPVAGMNDPLTELLESMSDAFIKLDQNWCFTYMNSRAALVFGKDPKAIIGKSIRTEFPEGSGQAFHINMEKAFATKQPMCTEEYYPPYDKWFENRIFPTESGLSIFFQDITVRKNAEIALRKSEERYRSLVEQAVDGIFHGDSLGNFIGVNTTGCEMTGRSKEELLSMNMAQLFTQAERERNPLRYDLLLEGNVVINERMLTRNDGSLLPVEMHTKMMPDGTYQSIFRDITERKKTEAQISESEMRYRTIFENTGTATVIIEEDTTISLANSGFELLSGYSREEIEHKKSWKNFVYQEDVDMMADRHISRRKDKTSVERSYEFRFVDKSGKIKDVLLTVDLIPGTSKSVASVLDITERKLIETRILQINEELENRVELRTRQLELAKEELELTNSTKDKFFSIIAHDLKGPLAAIILSSEMLIKTLIDDPDNKERLIRYSENILWSTQDGHKLLENLLEWSSAQAGAIKYEPLNIDLTECIRECIAPMKLNLVNKELHLEMPEHSHIAYVDKNMVNTIFRNLLSNAIKYSYKGGTISITMEQQSDYLLTSISDQGIGIPARLKDQLFNIDQSGSTPGTQNEQGIGLGLILCKEFIAKLGGTLWVESEEGKGSTFSFTVPVRATGR